MNKSKKGLGRGLSALFGDQNNNEKTSKNQAILRVPLDNIKRNEFQPRINFDETKLNELASSIKQNGIIQPIAVRQIKGSSEPYQIVAGERRWLAAQKAGLHEIPVTILELNDNEVLEVAIVENIQREDLNIVEEAKGYKRLNEEFGYDHDKIANMMSKSRSHVSNTSGSSPDSVKASVWQTPVALISTMTSPTAGPPTSTSAISRGLPASNATAARLFIWLTPYC